MRCETIRVVINSHIQRRRHEDDEKTVTIACPFLGGSSDCVFLEHIIVWTDRLMSRKNVDHASLPWKLHDHIDNLEVTFSQTRLARSWITMNIASFCFKLVDLLLYWYISACIYQATKISCCDLRNLVLNSRTRLAPSLTILDQHDRETDNLTWFLWYWEKIV